MKANIVRDFITGTFEALVDNYYRETCFNENQGIHFCISVDSECYGYEKDGNTHHPEWENRAQKYYHIIIVTGKQCIVTGKQIGRAHV